MSWYPATHWKTADDLKRSNLEASVRYHREHMEALVGYGDFEKAARVRSLMRERIAELRRMDGLCGECGRPRERNPRNPANLPITPTGTWIDPK